MTLQDELFAIEQGFWLDGADYFRAHLDADVMLVFPQAGEMHGAQDRERVAATATSVNRWRDLSMTSRYLLTPVEDVAIISYRADVIRADGLPYAALIGSAYVRRADGWKLFHHQHSPVGDGGQA